jgi:hypothetical protein
MTDEILWKTMDQAPRDGRAFLVQYLPYSNPKTCMRKVTFEVAEGGGITSKDHGAWLIVSGIDDEFSDGPTSGNPGWSIAPDDLNTVAAWRWREIPGAPVAVCNEIRDALAEAA